LHASLRQQQRQCLKVAAVQRALSSRWQAVS
jgi:hypothetical protein